MQPQVLISEPASAASLADVAAPMSVSKLKSRPDEVVGYHRTIQIRTLLLFCALVACHANYLPVWGMLAITLVLYPAIYLRIHDIGHGCAVSAYGWFARFPPTGNPIWGGTRVFALVHREHHKNLGTDRDPWLPYYTGHPLRALFFNFIEPEYSALQFVRMFGMDRELVLSIVFNVGCMTAGFVFFQETFLIHLLSLRVVHAAGIFFFNFYAHRETFSARAAIGNWEREADLRGVLPLLRLLWGADVVDGLIYHNRHHCLGQQHVPVQNYKHLKDTGAYTHFHDEWPIDAIKKLPLRDGQSELEPRGASGEPQPTEDAV